MSDRVLSVLLTFLALTVVLGVFMGDTSVPIVTVYAGLLAAIAGPALALRRLSRG